VFHWVVGDQPEGYCNNLDKEWQGGSRRRDRKMKFGVGGSLGVPQLGFSKHGRLLSSRIAL
jgi:hypothetical protein